MTLLRFRVIGRYETARFRFVGVEALVAVLEIDALYVVCVHVRRGINLRSCEVGLSGFISLHTDVRDNKCTGVSGRLALLTSVSVDVCCVLLFF